MFLNGNFLKPLLVVSVFSFGQSVLAQEPESSVCTARGLSGLINMDYAAHTHKILDVNFGRSMGKTVIDAYYQDDELTAIRVSSTGDGGKADMNYYFQNRHDYLMEYHIMQNSNFFAEKDSVVLTDEKSYFHVCDDRLLAPEFGGIIDDDIHGNLKLVLDIILTEEAAQ